MKIIVNLAALLCVLLSNPASAEAETELKGLSLKAFRAMPLDKRMEVCAQLVAPPQMGECVSVGKNPMRKSVVPSAQIQLAMEQCADELGSDDITEIAACAGDRLNKGSHPDHPAVTQVQLQKAQEYCARHYTGTVEVGSCVSSIMRQIDKLGGHN